MLSASLVRLIEGHSAQILTSVLHRIRNDPHFSYIRRLPEAELREWGQDILDNLSPWLTHAHEEEVGTHFEAQGRLRFEEEVPLHECVRGLFVLKDKMIEFVQEQGDAKTSLTLYVQEDLENRLGRFFDLATCACVAGYEHAMRQACRLAMTG